MSPNQLLAQVRGQRSIDRNLGPAMMRMIASAGDDAKFPNELGILMVWCWPNNQLTVLILNVSQMLSVKEINLE